MFATKKRLLLAVYRLEEGMQAVLEKLDAPERTHAPVQEPVSKGGDEWLKAGIDGILSYQAGAKRPGGEEKTV